MADCEEADADFSWESCWTSPVTRKRKKDRKRDKKALEDKSSITLKKDGSIQKKRKKKKASKFKEAMKERKQKKKEKKKKRVLLGLEDSFLLTQGKIASDPAAQRMRPEQSNQCASEQPTPERLTCDFLPKKKTKTKKKVAFDLSPGYIRVKRPKVVLASPKSPKDNILSENEVVTDERLLHSTVRKQSQSQTQDNDSQCTGDDTNSQDLFITQKTFRALSSEPSSEETHEDGNTSTPVTLSQHDRESHTPLTEHPEGLDTHRQDPQGQEPNTFPYFYEHPRKGNGNLAEPLKVQALLTNKTEGIHTCHEDPKKENPYFQVESNLTEQTEALHRLCRRTKVANPYLEQPILVNTFVDVTQAQKDLCTFSQEIQRSPLFLRSADKALLFPPTWTENSSTQTENFFTAELSSYLTFCRQRRVTASCEDLRPLDLSLPQRARSLLRSVKTSVFEVEDNKCRDQDALSSLVEVKADNDKEPSPSYSSGVKDSSEKKDPCGQHLWSSTMRRRDETTASPQSESEPKSSDTTTSSEDNEPSWRSSKMDLTQVRAVQMRLNESFFFKTKGEGQSPRPESPLMKLAQSREKSSRKRH